MASDPLAPTAGGLETMCLAARTRAVKRRAVLASLGAALPGLAGCASLTGGGAPERTLTPARVPDVSVGTPRVRITEAPGLSDCPRLPAEAERYICSPVTSGGLRLRPETKRHDGDPAGLGFTLHNGTEHGFDAGRGRWILTQRTANGWLPIDAGPATDELTVASGERVSWVVGGTSREARTGQLPVGASAAAEPVVRFATEFGSGVHTFVVTGDIDGRLTAVAAPFRVNWR